MHCGSWDTLVLSLALGNLVCWESWAPEHQVLGLISLPVAFWSLPRAWCEAHWAAGKRENPLLMNIEQHTLPLQECQGGSQHSSGDINMNLSSAQKGNPKFALTAEAWSLGQTVLHLKPD